MWATSFSVVQNTTFGWSPPGMRRRLPRNSYPSITGMFQSKRMASGNPRLHTSSAFSPSSASTIWKSRPSRMRLATFRMTLESSTTKHVFMVLPLLLNQFSTSATRSSVSSGHHFRGKFEYPIDIQDNHQLAVEPVHAAGKLGHAGIEVDRVFFAAVVGKLQHFTDLVDQEAIGFAAQVDADRHRRLAVLVLRHPETGTHVDHGDDAAAQIENAGDLARGQRHAGHALRHEHVLHPRDRQA